jgi:hypothetical protein
MGFGSGDHNGGRPILLITISPDHGDHPITCATPSLIAWRSEFSDVHFFR